MAAEPSSRPTLVLNPPDDAEFHGLATRLLDEGVRVPSAMERRLRDRHPNAVVRPRSLVGEPVAIWYVYRDGRWIGPRG